MAQINLKFSPEMETLIMQGKKICTTRDEQKGEIGDFIQTRWRSANTDRLHEHLGINPTHDAYPDIITG